MNGRALPRYLLGGVLCLLPCILIFSSFRTFRELEQQKRVYLRERVAEIAGQLEAMPREGRDGAGLSPLESEPNLRSVTVIARDSPDGSQPFLRDIWEGRELYRTEFTRDGAGPVYRAYVPFHLGGELRLARIDLDARAADFLVVHARHNIVVSLAGGLAVVLLSLYSVWLARRSAALERRQTELENLARLGRLSATLAHEIRNPLATIKGFTQLAMERSEAAAVLAPVLGETQRLENLVNALLAYGRPSAPSFREIEWNEIAQGLSTLPYLCIARPGVRFTTDPDLLKQALWNILRNAIDAAASASSPSVSLDVVPDGSETLRITISDNGPGIPSHMREKVLEPFFTTKASGTGLGLPIAQQLIRSIGGTLEIAGREPHGTEVRIVLENAAPCWPKAEVGAWSASS